MYCQRDQQTHQRLVSFLEELAQTFILGDQIGQGQDTKPHRLETLG